MMIREPAVAGRFYPADRDACRRDVINCIQRASEVADCEAAPGRGRIVGGVVPHAGWICSGAVAASVVNAIAAQADAPDAVIVFGAIHVLHGPQPSIFPSGAWETPLGLATIDARLSDRLISHSGVLESAPHAHDLEHSIEVEVPFLQHLLPDVRIVPIMVPVNAKSAALGRAVGRACRDYGVRAVFFASTDLTHYGPAYRFTPQGTGATALAWAKNVNDKRMIDLMLERRADDAVQEAVTHQNACGGGAIAATLAACNAYGATHSTLLQHTTSAEVLRELTPEAMDDAVGYAGIVFEE